ncbi:MAG TPA: PrsW family glutamic-type intramembrane protease [Bacteroidales bacterium]|nr:PrsW family glutamic-type intramembrane protease [Bacteroidales bacterium]HQI70530.1 PrsW family glutamic-type intramembrane protease [Bacteroidales bacterium]
MSIVSILLIAVPLAIAPGVGLCVFIYFKDKFEKEPFRLLKNSFLLGALSILPAMIIEVIITKLGVDENQGLLTTLIYAFLVVAFTEEGCKYFVLRKYIFSKPEFNEPFDGIVYSMMISMGFATVENLIYVVGSGLGTAVLRMFTAVPLHAVCAIILGYYAGKAKYSRIKTGNIVLGIFFAVFIHGLYDFFLFQKNIPALALLSFVALGVSIGLSFVAINKHQKNSPFRDGLSKGMVFAEQDNPPDNN